MEDRAAANYFRDVLARKRRRAGLEPAGAVVQPEMMRPLNAASQDIQIAVPVHIAQCHPERERVAEVETVGRKGPVSVIKPERAARITVRQKDVQVAVAIQIADGDIFIPIAVEGGSRGDDKRLAARRRAAKLHGGGLGQSRPVVRAHTIRNGRLHHFTRTKWLHRLKFDLIT